MPTSKRLPLRELSLDLNNFRTVHQKSETDAATAMITINPDWFWALTESLADSGYLPTENIIVLKKGSKHVVKEGNRRVAGLKILFGHISRNSVEVPANIEEIAKALTKQWKDQNSEVPCLIYTESERKIVDTIVTLTHGKSQRAGRDPWTAVARARHNRKENGAPEHSLCLLESYLQIGKNCSDHQRQMWSGDYPLTVLEEAMKKLVPRLKLDGPADLVAKYAEKTLKTRTSLEGLILDIGLRRIGFLELRSETKDFALGYGFPDEPEPKENEDDSGESEGESGDNSSGDKEAENQAEQDRRKKGKKTVFATNDVRSVKKALKSFRPEGDERNKLVTLIDEAKKLNVEKTPHAFCFILRSMFELSAKAFCKDYKILTKDKNGNDKFLVNLLREVVKVLTTDNNDKEMVKKLHGALTELAQSNSLLSVTSMNQLVHNPNFSMNPKHLAVVFNNMMPLLVAMNSQQRT